MDVRSRIGGASRWVLAAFFALSLASCGVNPVTGEQELQLVSESEEIAIGQQQYEPSQQMQGGDYVVDPAVGVYVQRVGQRLAAVADRPLPYEFVVLNSSVPNAWALPGGKIAVNRGLLVELGSEAELAAVLGHEIVHAAARHGAKSLERGMLLQVPLAALQIGLADTQYAGAVVGAAGLGAQLIMHKYGRDAELQSDYYGMQYMSRAGYNPYAAVTLQETFVRLSEGRQSNWLEGMFASHPPSAERVNANRATAATLGATGEYGKEEYARSIATLVRDQGAYAAYDKGVAALRRQEYGTARKLAQQAIAAQPQEARFYELLGDADLAEENYRPALDHYRRARERDPGYFKPYLMSGFSAYQLGRKDEAERYLARSVEMLPTSNAHYLLGRIAEEKGNQSAAMEHYRVAAESSSEGPGREAAAAYARLDFRANPDRYLATEPRLDQSGKVIIVVENRAPFAVRDIQLRLTGVNAYGQPTGSGRTFSFRGQLASGQRVSVGTGLNPPETGSLSSAVVSAQMVE